MTKYPPIIADFLHMVHGGDYNPDQWLARPDILEEDMRIAAAVGINSLTVGIFAWAALEPEEGVYTFGWLDETMDRLAAHGLKAVLATPSGSRPAWMAQAHPEVLRVGPDGVRNRYGERHNHCYTAPYYRDKTAQINTRLAERYKDHPALGAWHISNEYNGACYCPLCRAAFTAYLQAQYGTLDALNDAYVTAFWGHTYTAWDQVEPPVPRGEMYTHGLNLDWKRFVTERTRDFLIGEMRALKAVTPAVPCTTNLMSSFPGLNYARLAEGLDFVSWDNYPNWTATQEDAAVAVGSAFNHAIMRGVGRGKPFFMMESTPSVTNWQPIAKLKRPGQLLLQSLQAVAYGSDSVQYFQYRKSRGCAEKFHGAVIDHVGHEHTRVTQEVAAVGAALQKLDGVVGTTVAAQVALLFDWENWWAIDDSKGVCREKRYFETVQAHFAALSRCGVSVDIVDETGSFDGYRVLVAPMLYLLRAGVEEKIRAFVQAGGTVVATYMSGWVDQHDRVFLGGWPGPLREVLGVWCEEIDALYPGETNAIVYAGQSYTVRDLCELAHTEGAETLAAYTEDFYAGYPACTVNRYGQGQAYYVAARTDEEFLWELYDRVLTEQGVRRLCGGPLPDGVMLAERTDGTTRWLFAMNVLPHAATVAVGGYDLLTDTVVAAPLTLPPRGVAVLRQD